MTVNAGTLKDRLELPDGRIFRCRIGTIESTELGFEDDLRFTWAKLELNYGGVTQAYCPIVGSRSYPTVSLDAHVRGVLDVADVRSWEQLPGCYVVALFDENGGGGGFGIIQGLCRLDGSHVYLGEGLGLDEEIAPDTTETVNETA